jgi:hypothetical protein
MTLRIFKQAILTTALALTLLASAYSQAITGFDDIQYWVGTGSNRAALVIDWKDGTTTASMVWGYRWNGTKTGKDMVKAVAAAVGYYNGTTTTTATADGDGDPSLTLYIDTEYSFGDLIYTLDYSSGAITHSLGGFNVDSDGFWAYYTAANSSTLPTSWEFSSVGIGDRVLTNNSWDAFTWAPAPDYSASAPAAPVAVPGSGAGTPTPTPSPSPTATPTPTPTPEPPLPSAPTVKISLGSKVTTTKSSLAVKGVAVGEVSRVNYRVGSGRWLVAQGTQSWKFKARLKPGKNVVMVMAQGPGGNSAPAKIKVTRKP